MGVWGSNQFGQIGFPLTSNVIAEIKTITLSDLGYSNYNIFDVSCADLSTYIVMEEKKSKAQKIIRLGADSKEIFDQDSTKQAIVR